jgi:hypothetical protein
VGRVPLSRHVAHRRARRPAAGRSGRRALGAACLALACTTLVSCGGELRLVPPAGPSLQVTTEAPVAARATPVGTAVATQFGPIVWATAVDQATDAPIAPVSTYPPDAPRIIAALQAFGLSAGSVVEATWEYNNTSLDAFSTRLVPADSTAESWISFYLDRRPDVPWPVGTYEVTVSLNGVTVQQASIEITE